MSSAGKHVAREKRGKTCNRCYSRENIEARSVGEHATGFKGGKTCNQCRARKIASKVIRTDVDVAFDWLENLACLLLLVTVLARVFAAIIKVR